MKKIITILSAFLLCSFSIFSQSTFSSYCGYVKSFAMSWDDKCILISLGGVISQTDTSTGNVYWTSQINYQGQPFYVRSITQTSDSNFVALIAQIGTTSLISALKVTASGTLLWVKKYFHTATNIAWDLTHTQDGGFIMVGGGCSGENFAIRCDTEGNIIWQKQFRDTSTFGGSAFNISYAGNDNYYIAGMNLSINNDFNNILFKINGAGNLLWFRKIIMDGPDWNGGLIASNDGGATLAGTTNVLDSNVKYNYLAHFDSTGNNFWIKVYMNSSTENHSNGLIQLDDGNYIITGSVYYTDIRNVQMSNIKTDGNGNFIWAKTGGSSQSGGGYHSSFCIKKLSNSSFLVGSSFSFSKLNNNGYGWCYSDTINMTSIIPPYTIETPISPLVSNLNFISDTISYTYNIYPGFSPTICANITDVHSDVFDKKISIFPNPFLDELNFTTSNNEPSVITLYDIASKKILEQKFTNSVSINTKQLAKGLYLYEVQCGSSLCKKGKLVKN